MDCFVDFSYEKMKNDEMMKEWEYLDKVELAYESYNEYIDHIISLLKELKIDENNISTKEINKRKTNSTFLKITYEDLMNHLDYVRDKYVLNLEKENKHE